MLLAGCVSESTLRGYVPQIVTPYRIDIQQGNFITPDMVQKLAVGQTREQVRFILGTPLLVDIFRANRWDYVFRSSKGWNETEQRKLIVFFDATGRVERWEADLPPSAPGVLEKPAAAPQPKAQIPAAVAEPVQVAGVSNVKIDSASAAAGVPKSADTTAVAVSAAPTVPGAATPVVPVQAGVAAAAPAATAIAVSPPAAIVAPSVPAAALTAMPQDSPATPQAPAAASPARPAAQVPVPASVATPTAAASPSVILSALEEWRAAWARRDVDRYLSMYAPDFAPPAGLTRAQWEAQRRARLQRASFIVVKLLAPQISVLDDRTATAVFTQMYESDAIKESGRKTLALVQADGRWRIRDESFRK